MARRNDMKVGMVKPKHKLRVALVKSVVEEAKHHAITTASTCLL